MKTKNKIPRTIMLKLPAIKYYYLIWGIIIFAVCAGVIIIHFLHQQDTEYPTILLGAYSVSIFILWTIANSTAHEILMEYLEFNYYDEWQNIQKNPFTSSGGVNTLRYAEFMLKKEYNIDANIVKFKKYNKSLIRMLIIFLLSWLLLIFLLIMDNS